LSGARRKEERWDTEKAGNVQTTRKSTTLPSLDVRTRLLERCLPSK